MIDGGELFAPAEALGAKRWIAIQVLAFGAICLATGFVKNYAQLIVGVHQACWIMASPDGNTCVTGPPCAARHRRGWCLARSGFVVVPVLHPIRVGVKID
jgi:hypothetical protein